VDDRPFGGGEGMVLKPEPLFECIESLGVAPRAERLAGRARESVVLLSPQGQLFSQPLAAEMARLERLVFICGRYEGVDERVCQHIADREISIGDYVLSGGELPAAVMIDTVVRLLPGALGNQASAWQESFGPESPQRVNPGLVGGPDGRAAGEGPDSTCASGGLLDYPHYTRPADYRAMPVPGVLLGGNHDEIRRWRRRMALEKTLRNRPDLLARVALSQHDKELLARIQGDRGLNPDGSSPARPAEVSPAEPAGATAPHEKEPRNAELSDHR
jgi:tRNA (guanine37-N1)-methyltransferase